MQTTLLDVNVLIALCDKEHIHHGDAARWFYLNAKAGWASCPLTQNGAIRIMSNSKYPNSRPIGMVIEQINQLCNTSYHHFWNDNLSLIDSTIFNRRHLLIPKQITDTYLLALAVNQNGKFLTIDRGISLSSVVGAQKQHLEKLI